MIIQTQTAAEPLIEAAPLLSAFISESRTVVWIKTSASGIVLEHNEAAQRITGCGAPTLKGSSLWEWLTEAHATALCSLQEGTKDRCLDRRLINFVAPDGTRRTLAAWIAVQSDGMFIIGEPDIQRDSPLEAELLAVNSEFATLLRENERKTKALEAARRKLEEAAKELQDSYWHIRKIHEVLPICMGCGKVKTETSKWEDVVAFLKNHTRFLSHGYCPPCGQEVLETFRSQSDKHSKDGGTHEF